MTELWLVKEGCEDGSCSVRVCASRKLAECWARYAMLQWFENGQEQEQLARCLIAPIDVAIETFNKMVPGHLEIEQVSEVLTMDPVEWQAALEEKLQAKEGAVAPSQ
jgi:hypothetical protein